MENSTKPMLILTVTAAMILATAIGVANVTQAAHADKGGTPDAHVGTYPLKSCISHPTQNKSLDPRLQYNMMIKNTNTKI